MSGLGKQLRGSGIAKVLNQRTSFGDGGDADKGITPVEKGIKPIDPVEEAFTKAISNEEAQKHMKRHKKASGGRAGYVQGGGAKVGEVKVKIPPYLKKGMVKMGFKKGGSAKPGLWANINRRKKLGISRPKSKSTISAKAYSNMKKGFPK